MTVPTTPTPYQARILGVPRDVNVISAGARGPGKSVAADFDIVRSAVTDGELCRPLVVREEWRGLAEREDALEAMLTVAFGSVQRNRQEHTIRCPNGAVIEFAQIDGFDSYKRHQGRSASALYGDDLGAWRTDRWFNLLKSNLRGPVGHPRRVMITANPGGLMSQRLARLYVNGRRPWEIFDVDGEPWVLAFADSHRLNPHLDADDYERKLRASCGSDEELLKAWLNGDFTALRGSMFGDCWTSEIVIPFEPTWKPHPDQFSTSIAMDFGVHSPSVALFAAHARINGVVAPGGLRVPRGTIIVIDELTTALDDDLETAHPTAPQTLAMMVLERCKELGVRPTGVCDDAVGLDPTAQGSTVLRLFQQAGLFLRTPQKSNRPERWAAIRQRLTNTRERTPDRPWLLVSESARYLHVTAPVHPRSKLRPSDLESRGPDHGLDALSYLVSSPAPGDYQTTRPLCY